MGAHIKRVGNFGISMVGKGDSGHWIPMDGPATFGGHSAATRPIELFLVGLGGCTGMDVLSILEKMQVKLDDFEVKVEEERAPQHPKVFTKIHLHYIFYGTDLDEAKLQKAIKLSEERYCSATAMLKATVEMHNTYEVRPPVGIPKYEKS